MRLTMAASLMSETDRRALVIFLIIAVVVFIIIALIGYAIRKTMAYQMKRADTFMHDVTITQEAPNYSKRS